MKTWQAFGYTNGAGDRGIGIFISNKSKVNADSPIWKTKFSTDKRTASVVISKTLDGIGKTKLGSHQFLGGTKSHGKGRQLHGRPHRKRKESTHLGKSISEVTLRDDRRQVLARGIPHPPSPHTHPRCSQCRVFESLGHAHTHSLTFFLSLLNFFCRASSSSLQSGVSPTWWLLVRGQGPRHLSPLSPPRVHTPSSHCSRSPFQACLLLSSTSPYPLLNQAAVQAHLVGISQHSLLSSGITDTSALGHHVAQEAINTRSRGQDDGTRPPISLELVWNCGVRKAEEQVEPRLGGRRRAGDRRSSGKRGRKTEETAPYLRGRQPGPHGLGRRPRGNADPGLRAMMT